jgi:hypothetical protein
MFRGGVASNASPELAIKDLKRHCHCSEADLEALTGRTDLSTDCYQRKSYPSLMSRLGLLDALDPSTMVRRRCIETSKDFLGIVGINNHPSKAGYFRSPYASADSPYIGPGNVTLVDVSPSPWQQLLAGSPGSPGRFEGSDLYRTEKLRQLCLMIQARISRFQASHRSNRNPNCCVSAFVLSVAESGDTVAASFSDSTGLGVSPKPTSVGGGSLNFTVVVAEDFTPASAGPTSGDHEGSAGRCGPANEFSTPQRPPLPKHGETGTPVPKAGEKSLDKPDDCLRFLHCIGMSIVSGTSGQCTYAVSSKATLSLNDDLEPLDLSALGATELSKWNSDSQEQYLRSRTALKLLTETQYADKAARKIPLEEARVMNPRDLLGPDSAMADWAGVGGPSTSADYAVGISNERISALAFEVVQDSEENMLLPNLLHVTVPRCVGLVTRELLSRPSTVTSAQKSVVSELAAAVRRSRQAAEPAAASPTGSDIDSEEDDALARPIRR